MQVILMRGIAGCGKSSWVKDFLEQTPPDSKSIVCSADHYHIENGVYTFKPENISIAHDRCFLKYLYIFSQKESPNFLFVDNTNVSLWELAPYYRYAEVRGAKVKIIRCECNPITAYKRNTHGVPAKVILQMYESLRRESVPPWWNEEIVFTE